LHIPGDKARMPHIVLYSKRTVAVGIGCLAAE
jgi:hypothetical protein